MACGAKLTKRAKCLAIENYSVGYDADDDGQLSVAELTAYWVEMSAKRSMTEMKKPDLSA